MPVDVRSIMDKDQEIDAYILKKIKWPLQILELLICNLENATLALDQTDVIAQVNRILTTYGQPQQQFTPEIALLIKTAARILATVMNQIPARA